MDRPNIEDFSKFDMHLHGGYSEAQDEYIDDLEAEVKELKEIIKIHVPNLRTF